MAPYWGSPKLGGCCRLNLIFGCFSSRKCAFVLFHTNPGAFGSDLQKPCQVLLEAGSWGCHWTHLGGLSAGGALKSLCGWVGAEI